MLPIIPALHNSYNLIQARTMCALCVLLHSQTVLTTSTSVVVTAVLLYSITKFFHSTYFAFLISVDLAV
jgi:hypothetical protein